MTTQLLSDISYFVIIYTLYKRKINIIIPTITYYTIQLLFDQCKGAVNMIHHYVAIIVLIASSCKKLDIHVINKIIVFYNFTTLSLLLLLFSVKQKLNKSLIILSYISTVYFWIKIRVIWTFSIKSRYIYPFLFMNIYWLFLLIKKGITFFSESSKNSVCEIES